MKKINFKNIAVAIFCIILIYCFLLAGSPLQNNMHIINVLFNIVAILIIIKNFKNIKITKIEIAILALILVGFIPIIFRTQSSLNSTIDSILKYIAVWNVYIIVKYIIKVDNKYVNYFINSIIIASLILIIFGIDMMNNNILKNVYDFLDTIVITNSSKVRMDSVFEYPNSFAMFLGISFILSITRAIKFFNISKQSEQKNIKNDIKIILYVLASCFQIYGIIMSGSRLTILMLIAIFILWCILERKKIFKKKTIIITSIIFALCIIAIALCFIINTNLVLFDETKKEESQYTKQINNIQPNTEYDFNFEIQAVNNTIEKDKFKIFVREYTDRAKKIEQKEIKFDNFNGTKNLHIKTQDETSMIRICFVSENTIKGDTKLEVKSLTMNGQKIKLNYLFLPISFVNRIENISIGESSVTERFVFIKDGIRLGMQHFFTGLGNDGWRYNYKTVREYNYGANQMHCYIVDLFIQNGILGFVVIIGLFTLLGIKIVKIIKQKSKEYYPIIFAILFGLMHSLLDFDMNFYSILVLMFILIAILDTADVKEKNVVLKNIKAFKVLGLLCMMFVLIVNICSYTAYKIDEAGKDDDLNYKNWKEKLDNANLKVILAPYNYDYLTEKIQIETMAKNSSYVEIDEQTSKAFTDDLIKILTNVVSNEQDRDISDSYRRLMINYVDDMNENNIEETLQNIENLRNIIDNKYKKLDKTMYFNYVHSIYSELVYELEEKNTTFKNDSISNVCKELNEILEEEREVENNYN